MWRGGSYGDFWMMAASSNVARFLPEQAREQPDAIALRVPLGKARGAIHYRSLSFAELDQLSDGCGKLLQARGVSRGDRVLLMVRPGLELILSVFALFKLGAVPVVIDPGMGLKRFLECVKRTQPDALVGILPAIAVAKTFRSAFEKTQTQVRVGGATFWKQIQDYSGDGRQLPIAETAVDDPAAVLFTSGSTGAPKGVVYEHGMFDAQVRLLKDSYGIEPGEVDLPMLPVFALFNPALGMTTVVPQMDPSRPARADPWQIVQAVRQNDVTNSFGSPVLWKKIADYCERTETQLPSLKRILMAGAPVPPRLIERLRVIAPSAMVHTPYGATECLPLTTINGAEILADTAEKTAAGAGSCVGRPVAEVQVRVIHVRDEAIDCIDNSLLVGVGQIGEIVANGPVVTKAYDKLPVATAMAKMVDDSGAVWHRMGDLGYFDIHGRLWFCGRKVERVETERGTCYTDCCEAIFNAHPDVNRTALIGLTIKGQKEPAIVVEPLKGRYPSGLKARKNFIEELMVLGAQHIHTREITRFFFDEAFPVDVRHNAKIHRLALARKAQKKVGK